MMDTKIVEATNGFNWGKFMLCRHTTEWTRHAAIKSEAPSVRALLSVIGWTPRHLWVLDLQTGEGALFLPGGDAISDLNKHRIWVCPMYQPFLEWLYKQNLTDLQALPDLIDLEGQSALYGYRRTGAAEDAAR